MNERKIPIARDEMMQMRKSEISSVEAVSVVLKTDEKIVSSNVYHSFFIFFEVL